MDMMIGSVLGPVTLARAVAGAEEKRFVQVRCGGALLTALDPLGAEPGQPRPCSFAVSFAAFAARTAASS